MRIRKSLTLAQRFLLLGGVVSIALGIIIFWLRGQCLDARLASLIGCGNTDYDNAVLALNVIAGGLMIALLPFLHRYPRALGLFAAVLGIAIIWLGDAGSFFGGLFSLSSGLLTLTSLV